jgi:hypothetical protein
MQTNIHKREATVTPLIFPKAKQSETKIINLVVNKEKLTVQLNDGRELSIPIDWFAKWGVNNVNANKLKKHEI